MANHVAATLGYHPFAAVYLCKHCNHIRHRSRGQEEPGGFPKHGRGERLELGNRRIVSPAVVSYRG